MEAIVEGENLKQALAQVKRNKGAAGIDGMSGDDGCTGEHTAIRCARKYRPDH
jgi:hypothetical protein